MKTKIYADPDDKKEIIKEFSNEGKRIIEQYEKFYNEKPFNEKVKQTYNQKLKKNIRFINPKGESEERMRGVIPIQKEESIIGNKSYEEIKESLQGLAKQTEYREEFVRRVLHDKPHYRKTFAAVIMNNPARFHEIQQKVFCAKKTTYAHLWKLQEIGIINRISIMDIWNKEKLDQEQKEILNKFKKWTEQMTPNQLQYFAAKTNYYVLTDLGKEGGILNWVLKLENSERI